MHIVKTFLTIIKCLFRARFEYPGAFLGGIVAQWVSYAISILMIYIMVWNFGALAGWQPVEVIFLYAVGLLTYALGASFTFTMCINFPQMAINGTIDEAYTRPVPPFIYIMATNFNVAYISHISLTAVVLGVSIFQLGLSWTIFQWLWFVVLIISGAIITGCLMLICDMPAIRTRSQSPTSMLFWQVRAFNEYPIIIYPRPFQLLFTTVLPFGFVAFYPIQVLLGRHDGIFPQLTRWLSPLVAVLTIGVTVLCWRILSSKYESAGT